MRDYEILGIEQNATPPEIKNAFWALAKRYHPDGACGDADKFVEIRRAYETAMQRAEQRLMPTKLFRFFTGMSATILVPAECVGAGGNLLEDISLNLIGDQDGPFTIMLMRGDVLPLKITIGKYVLNIKSELADYNFVKQNSLYPER